MNSPKNESFVDRKSNIQMLLILIPAFSISVFLTGCGDNVHPPTAKQLIEFENAGPMPPSV
ncbi:MAG: hypothetical protein JXA81_01035, partial [Sedimentisphaerales bacterium]|nr:hypothetical protein [Sedimentisphaerales bacterium]